MNLILKIWQQLPMEIQFILKWLFDKHLAESMTIFGAFFSFLLLKPRKIIDALMRFRVRHNLKNHLPDFTPQEIDRGIKYYIWPECQSVDPAQSDEVRQTVAVRDDLCSTMDRLLQENTIHNHFILLADTGMGKTSFLVNYFAHYLRSWRKSYSMDLIPLGLPKLEERLRKIPSPENTILLLDAFDEDTEAIHDHTQRLGNIMKWTRSFYRIIITCRSQFFPRDEEIPQETGIIKVGPRAAGEGPQFTFYKLYLSPFRDNQVLAYLRRRFPFWRRGRRKKALDIIDKIPNLVVRPMLLAYVDDLIDSDKIFKNCYQIYVAMIEAWIERERRMIEDKESLSNFSHMLAVELFANREKRGSERIPYGEIAPLAQKFKIDLATWQLAGRSLLNRDAEGNYKFAHRSILEFLFAQQLLGNDEKAFRVPVKYWTEQVKIFLADGLDGRPLRFSINFISFKGGAIYFDKSKKNIDIKPFEMSIYPVTNREYEEFDPLHHTKRNQYSDQDDQPVVNVSWEDAVRYCQWLSDKTGQKYRLPNEREWEFAASGGGQRQYPWGNEAPNTKRANYSDSKIGATTLVGSYPLGMTPEGVLDMAGNVWEWCKDWYDKEEKFRVVRGGSFSDFQDGLRCANRGRGIPECSGNFIGFRVVRGA